METLNQLKCTACRRGEPTVTDAEIAELHPQVPAWDIVDRGGIRRLERVFTFDRRHFSIFVPSFAPNLELLP